MAKKTVIFSDFYDTLATYAIQGKDERGLKEFHILYSFLVRYLQKNRYMFVISNAGGHASLKDSAKIYNRLYHELENNYRDNLFFYMIGNPLEEHEKTASNFKVVTDSKEKIVEKIIEEKNITSEDIVVGAGDTGSDIDMLFKISDFGGKSFYNIYRCYDEVKQPDEYYIRSIAYRRACFLIEQQCEKRLSSELKSEKEYEIFLGIYNELESKYVNGELSSKELELMYYYSQISFFDYNSVANLRRKEEKIISEEEVAKKLILVKSTEELYHQFYKFS